MAVETFPSLSMTRVDNIADGKGWLEDLRDFALSVGWTSESYETSVEWDDSTNPTVYSWEAGSGDFLQLYSSGYNGVQKLRYRFYCDAETGEDTIQWSLIDPSYSAVDSSISALPYASTSHHCVSVFAYTLKMSFPQSTFAGSWFIGNDRFIAWEAEVASGAALVSGAIGTYDLPYEYQNIAGELAGRWSGFYRYTNNAWDDYETNPTYFGQPLRNIGHTTNQDYVLYWNSKGVAGNGTENANFAYALSCCPDGDDDPDNWNYSQFGKDHYMIKHGLNSYSNKRVLIQPKVYLKDSDDQWMYSGVFPLYNMVYTGLTMGQQITYGGKTYICFPNGLNTNTYGHCYDIT